MSRPVILDGSPARSYQLVTWLLTDAEWRHAPLSSFPSRSTHLISDKFILPDIRLTCLAHLGSFHISQSHIISSAPTKLRGVHKLIYFASAIHASTSKVVPASLCWRISDMICKFVPMCQLLFISLLPEIFMCWSQILCLLPVADQIPDFHLNWWLITGSFLYMIDRCILLVSAPLISIHWRVALLPVARIRMCAWAVIA